MEHVPPRMPVPAMAHFDGREPAPTGSTPRSTSCPSCRPKTRTRWGGTPHGFTGEDAGSGRRLELVALPDGGAFDLLGMSG
jgi:hypothetical protein